MTTGTRICILTSSHDVDDVRIFYKQAKSLHAAGYETTLVAPYSADEVMDGIRIKAVPEARGKLGRLLLTPHHVLVAGLKEKADIYHFHDPELITVGLLLRLMGKKVVYDVHEYYKLKLKSKTGIPGCIRGLIAQAFDIFETIASKSFNGVIVVDQTTADKFNGQTVQVANYPYLPEGTRQVVPEKDGVFRCVYIGGLWEDRGLFKMVEAMGYVDSRVRLVLIGENREEDQHRASALKGYEKVDWLGHLQWPEAIKLFAGFDLGLVLLQPTPAYLYAGENTVKLWEYMMSGLPVLSSDFPNLKEIIEKEGCGLTVDPTNPVEIASRIMYLVENPKLRQEMGRRGKEAVNRRYNWEAEFKKMLALYDRILNKAA